MPSGMYYYKLSKELIIFFTRCCGFEKYSDRRLGR